jgi:hypothetical protein
MAELADRIRSQDRRDREREVYCAFGCSDEESELKSAFGSQADYLAADKGVP